MGETSLYETDILAWSEQQAAVLRHLAARPDRPNDLDIDNVVEEIEAVGWSQLNAVESRLRLILSHALKAMSEPEAQTVPHWRRECGTWHADIQQAYAPSMRQRLDVPRIWKLARKDAVLGLEEFGVALQPGLPEECPVTLDDLLDPDFDMRNLVALMQARLAAR